MEYYSYVNIFETKGVAYILLLSFLVMFVLLVKYLSAPAKKPPTRNGTNSATDDQESVSGS